MNDNLISREALKKYKFTTQIANGVELEDIEVVPLGVIDNAPTVEQSYQTPKDYIRNKLDYSRPQGEWIPVSEKLPDLFEVVLVTDEIGKVFEYERRPLDDDGNVSREWSFLGRNIIAWMPLPEPYKEAENEDSN